MQRPDCEQLLSFFSFFFRIFCDCRNRPRGQNLTVDISSSFASDDGRRSGRRVWPRAPSATTPPPPHSPAPRCRFPADRQTNKQSGLKVTPSRSAAADWLDLGPLTVGWSPIARLPRPHLPRRPAAASAACLCCRRCYTGGPRTMATAGRCIVRSQCKYTIGQ